MNGGTHAVIASEAKQSRAVSRTMIGKALDCFAVARLAMTVLAKRLEFGLSFAIAPVRKLDLLN
jgi:hypothetical protein